MLKVLWVKSNSCILILISRKVSETRTTIPMLLSRLVENDIEVFLMHTISPALTRMFRRFLCIRELCSKKDLPCQWKNISCRGKNLSFFCIYFAGYCPVYYFCCNHNLSPCSYQPTLSPDFCLLLSFRKSIIIEMPTSIQSPNYSHFLILGWVYSELKCFLHTTSTTVFFGIGMSLCKGV